MKYDLRPVLDQLIEGRTIKEVAGPEGYDAMRMRLSRFRRESGARTLVQALVLYARKRG